MRYNYDTFYVAEAAAGYIDYPFVSNVVAQQAYSSDTRTVK